MLHCYSGKNGGAKDQAAKRFGTWHLPASDKSESMPPFASTARKLFNYKLNPDLFREPSAATHIS